ncbi:MAG: hypothetical protein QOE89_2347, partial [Pseudonocardiales bacterium]|nr:hypothetical protein [Pseudonocardiales bacterium]
MSAVSALAGVQWRSVRLNRGTMVACVLAGWVLLFGFVRGHDTLSLASADVNGLHTR